LEKRMPNEMVVGKIEFAPSVTGAKSPTDWYAHWKHQSELNAKLVDALRDVLEICRQWEPDCASGKDRNTLAKAHVLLTPNKY